ncbi:MAG: hypothetical protein K0R29_2022 [Pseudobdellovibrio sp.]|nr:hypothetical protein [Pseudobdellovibrio sp.]
MQWFDRNKFGELALFISRIVALSCFILCAGLSNLAYAGYGSGTKGFDIDADIFGSHNNLLPFKGYQDDLSASIFFSYDDGPLRPFVRSLTTNYYYVFPNMDSHVTDFRKAVGGGFDYHIADILRFRYIQEKVENRLAQTEYIQNSYGFIYNQYLEFSEFDMNNYLESFYIPRFSDNSADTFFRMQLLKPFYLSYDERASNTFYPFAQFKSKVNDDAIFGVYGSNASVGVGYKIYASTEGGGHGFSAVFEANSVFWQSKDFDGDWVQALAAIQWMIY